jgi:hypothetical protein
VDQSKQELEKEMKKCKEIVAQEYEFKMKHLDETYLQKETQLVEQYQADRD